MSLNRESLIRKLVRELIKQELDEANSTASVGGSYNTPHAFSGSNKKGTKKGKAGYTKGHEEPTRGTGLYVTKNPKLRKESINESKTPGFTNRKFGDPLPTLAGIMKNHKSKVREGKYHDYRNDESMSAKQKIGQSMREVRDKLNELDKLVKMNVKLKTELSIDSRSYWKNTHKAMGKISEKLVKLSNKIGKLY
ncbi:hypothetical protein HN385_07595 [archaeon]|jgi:hypothetical protein|nr:hypothetical protein [archaeon]MBT4207435.1 hypothetical protein [Candidatus Woesearchaeota archaeon]MBT4732229.1 hypothetical protein [Candidatus Woesearchaeota archaeon]MBT5758859.1 hypothetical protein [Candidatus Neomarinimicrobiota bacterium]MBT7557260.1 hypothetical protein [Candidatus Woesearchaeota archaeon]